ncbi:MAG TPA: ABC transporter substrate-binding protein [Beijerinckiaceae bacterium]|jgi:putative ABC transport system substrate-binding protein
MKRREFIALAGAAAWPLAAPAQQRALPVIGFMSGRWPEESAEVFAAFHRGLAEAGYTDGRNVLVEQRWAEGHYERLPAIAAELVEQRVAVLVAVGGGVSGLAAKAATATTPIVFASGGDAVQLGLVVSLNRPGGNVTGVNLVFGALGAKRLELLREVIPQARSIAVLVNPAYPSAAAEIAELQAAASTLGLKAVVLESTREDAIAPAFDVIASERSDGLLVADDPFLQGFRNQIVTLAAHRGIPAVYFSRDFAAAGGLMSYGGSITEGYRLVGIYAGRILEGAKPAELPVVQPTKFELVINLKTAKALGLAIPPTLLARADEVIE